ncbi:porin family protein [Tenacibaculum haliotis]|uniref:porin family protein n=1 Tax=Tenacibaculum haliotis TaxID=1888914 RepID=UPI0021AEDDA8|nr:porin family protein [Tenacibaculum haliotis]MCT4698875.1 PorT family protein [Tenacibaculum haliotis]
MKKVLLTIAIVAAGFTVNAQEVTFGAKAGLNIANVSGDGIDDNDARTSFHIGAVAEIEISDKFSVQPELVYSAQGAKTKMEGIDVTMALDYLNVPVMAKYYVAEGFSLELGPQIGFLMSAKMKAEVGGESVEEDIKDDYKMKSVDFGLNFGAGYKLESGLNFSARYNLGLSKISDIEDSTGKNGVFQVSVGYNF